MTGCEWAAMRFTAPDQPRDVHVIPLFDLRPHEMSPTCWCRPVEDDEELGVWQHNAQDGREAYERSDLDMH